MTSPIYTPLMTLALGLLALQLVGCSKGESQPAEHGMSAPQQVTVIKLQPQDLPATFEYVGRLEASREIEIRPRVTGLIEQRLFQEGSQIQAGQPLFQLDTAPFVARKQALEAALAEARARLTQAEREAKRLAPLVKTQSVSQRDLDDALSTRDLNRAAVAAAEAELSQAQLDLDYTRVESPIAGHIGRALQVEGALVSSTTGPLARLAQIDPLYVRFSVAENQQLDIDRQLAAGNLRLPPLEQSQVEVQLADGSIYPLTGQVDFSDYRTDPQTGAYDRRATLPNPDARLTPGQFVRVRVKGGVLPNALAVPQRAVQEDANGKFVYVVGQGEKGMTIAQSRPVEVGQWVEKVNGSGSERLWVINSGLAEGDQVVIEGTARIFFPGMPIQPQPPDEKTTEPPSSTNASSSKEH
ncbi:MAG: efflux RND transporter periplasmic adaptor subunit [Sedimenticola thiotaurini]|uniref:Efflux RND transporter periplasmic adaptor subunit n=1 Tax=Sedimenticola thiotaurini TaxID=1543721 RepID=A0A558CST6_9GAMM|nr:MAG: efflux RND transporter periplasmic adaptor subunit [Sedimenticola thiotaurini]